MCHHHEVRRWATLRDELEEAEPDGVECEAPEPELEIDDGTGTADRLPPIQSSD